MTDKELQKLGRRELLQMLLEQVQESQRLERELSKTAGQLHELEETYDRLRDRLNKKDAQIHQLQETLQEEREQKEADLEEVGSIAEAALKLNGVFDAAQKAAAQYLQHLQTVYPVPEGAEIPSISEFWKQEMAVSETERRQQNNFGAPDSGFISQSDSFTSLENNFGVQSNGFATQGGSFAPQSATFAMPDNGFGAQANHFVVQSSGYAPPNSGFAPPENGFGVQNNGFGVPDNSFAWQNVGFGVQNNGFQPQSGYTVPGNSFGTQSDNRSTQETAGPAVQAAMEAEDAKKIAGQKPRYNNAQRPRPQTKRPAQTLAEEEFADLSEEEAQIQLPLRSKRKPKSGWTLYFGWKRDQGRKM